MHDEAPGGTKGAGTKGGGGRAHLAPRRTSDRNLTRGATGELLESSRHCGHVSARTKGRQQMREVAPGAEPR